MIKPRLLKISKILFIAFLGLSIGSCSPEDGENGTNGTNGIDGKDGIGIDGKDGKDGTNGTNGTNGADGKDGENGLGLDDLIKYGSITTTISGNRPDGVAFEQNNIFRYTSAGASYSNNNVTKNGNDLSIDITRFLSVADDVYQDVFTSISFRYENGTPELLGFDIQELKVFSPSDNKYFTLDLYAEQSEIQNPTITSYSFDSATNNLKFSYSFTIDGGENTSNNVLTVTGVVDVLLFEEIQAPQP